MPGPVSDSYDPEFGTSANAEKIQFALAGVYGRVSGILKNSPPLPILELVDRTDLTEQIPATLTEREWRLIRFALERSQDSL